MRWLITTKEDVNPGELRSRLAGWGCERTGRPPIPLGDDELAIEVFGPEDLPEKAKSEAPDLITRVNPSSPMTLY